MVAPRARPYLAPAGGIVLLALLAYLVPLLRAGWIWDDDMYVLNNSTLRSVAGLGRIWLDPRALPQYYPMVHTTFWIEHHLFGLVPRAYHLVNLFLHSANAVLLFVLLRRLAVPGAWLAAAVFAVHPVHVESVAWVTERKNVLSAFFYLLAALSLLRFFRVDDRDADRTGPVRAYAAGALLFLCALLSKTVTASLPAALLLVLWWKKDSFPVRRALWLLPLFVVGAAFGLTTAWLEKHHVGAQGEAWDLGVLERCLIAGRALWFYAWKLVWPVELTFIYPRWRIDPAAGLQYLFPAAALVALGTLWIARRRIGKGPLVGTLFFAGTLVPALGFFNVFPMRYSFVADHFQYLASAGLIATLCATVAILLAQRPSLARATAGAVVVLLSILTWRQVRAYENQETLWRDTLAKNPAAWMAHTNLGMLLVHSGRVEEGMEHYRESIRLEPSLLEPRLNLGEILQKEGKPDEAIVVIEQAVRLHPDNAIAHYNLGTALAKRGRYAEAVTVLLEAVRLMPDLVEAEYNLGTALLNLGRLDEAAMHLRQVLGLRPDHAGAHLNLARVLELQGKQADAQAHRSEGLRLKRSEIRGQQP